MLNARVVNLCAAAACLGLIACDSVRGKDISDVGDCENCHQGIEPAHPWLPTQTCVSCHGGVQEAKSKQLAHVPVPANWAEVRGTALAPAPFGFIKDFAPDQLAALDPAYVRFINPSDIRVVMQTCGLCHVSQALSMPKSIMTTNAGHYYPTLYLAGVQDQRMAIFGAYPAASDTCDESEGSVCNLVTLTPPSDEEIQAAIDSGDPSQIEAMAYKHYLSKDCNTCHQAGYPRNNSPGLYRSTGCASCHMPYNKQGTYEGADPMIPKQTPVYPRSHTITSAIPTEQCATCHFQGGRIGLTFRGIREGGFSASSMPANATYINETLYGHAPGFYVSDEDASNTIDETPPDLHYAAGMHCVDCHVGSDVHGNNVISSTSKQQIDIRCEDCHGTVRQRATPNANGSFVTLGGRVLPQLKTDSSGSIVLTGKVDGRLHTVPQPADLLAEGGTATVSMHVAMGIDGVKRADGTSFSHTDSLTCDTCHTSWTQKCIGCHVSLDLRLKEIDYQTGKLSSGFTRGSRDMYSLDTVLLVTGRDGRVQSAAPSQQVQMAVFGSESFGTGEGELLFGEEVSDGEGGTRVLGEFRHGDGSRAANNGFLPFFQHTTSRRPRRCSACHRKDDSAAEMTRVRGVYGYGTGEFILAGPGGTSVDGLQFLDAAGNEITDWVYDRTGPVEQTMRERAINVIIESDRP